MMEEATTMPQNVPEKKRDTASTTSRSSSRSSGHKRQRIDSKKSMDSSADFISLDFSDGDGEEPIEEEYISIKCISKPALLDSTGNNTPVTTNGSGADEKNEEGGMEEKTTRKSKRKRRVRKRGAKETVEAVAKREANDLKEQPGSLSLEARAESSDEDGYIKIAPVGSTNSKDGESEEEDEEEDKDSSTRRTLKTKKLNDTHEGREIEKPDVVETAVATASNPEFTSVNQSNGTVISTEELEKDSEGMTVKDKKNARRKERKRQRKGMKKAEKKAQVDLPKGGGFNNLPDEKDDSNQGDEVVDISSDDENDSGLEINVDLDIDDLVGEKKAKNNGESDEEGEVAEKTAENGSGPKEDESDSSGDDGDDSPLVDQAIAIQQRKYYTAFVPPPFKLEEARPLFSPVGVVDFKADLVQEREAAAIAAEAFRESKRICNVCTKKGHSEDNCEELKCKHCGSWNKHFSHACPDAERSEEDEPRVRNKWRRIPPHFHKPINSTTTNLPIFCYYCAGNDHFGDECPRCPPPKAPGSFSLTDINLNTYATQEWLLDLSDKLEVLESESGKSKGTFGKAGTKMTVNPPPDPFKHLRNIDGSLPKRPPPAGPARSGGRDQDSYKPRNAPRDGNNGPYRQRSPIRDRDPVFDRYRDLPPRPPPGLPQRPRSRSPQPRYRSGGGGGSGRGGGGAGRGGGGGHRPPADYYNRPAPREGGGGGSRGGYNGGGGSRAYESRSQPPLPNEPVPRRGEAYRSRGNWPRYKT